jgi:ribosomal protein S18 acetylase RimI-like enzyme
VVTVDIRAVTPDEYARLGALTALAYTSLPGYVDDPEYIEELHDVRSRAEAPGCDVLVAVDDDGTVLGGVTFVGDPTSPMAEHGIDGAASIRMLAVDPAGQGRGVGGALARECVARAAAVGATAIVLHSTPWMDAAHRLYGRLGFVRDESLDIHHLPGIDLWGFRLDL